MILSSNYSVVLNDIIAAALSFFICRSLVGIMMQKLAKGLLGVHMARKLIHISIGLVVMLCWPMFSVGRCGAFLAGVVPGAYTVEQIFRIRKDGSQVMKRSRLSDRYPHYRDLVKAVLGHALGTLVATFFYWRTPIAIAAISNLSAGDGVADIVGRRFGSWKLPYNRNKSFAGSIAMTIAGFLCSLGCMYYFSWLEWIDIEESHGKVDMMRLLIVSVASALVESHPLSSKFDDNLTVPLAAIFVAKFVF